MHASGTEYRVVEEPKGRIRDAGQLRGELHQEILSPKADGAILWSPGGGTLSALNSPGPLGLLQASVTGAGAWGQGAVLLPDLLL